MHMCMLCNGVYVNNSLYMHIIIVYTFCNISEIYIYLIYHSYIFCRLLIEPITKTPVWVQCMSIGDRRPAISASQINEHPHTQKINKGIKHQIISFMI